MARTSEASREDVKNLWGEMREAENHVTAVKVYDELKIRNHHVEVRSLRTVQDDILSFKKDLQDNDEPFAPVVWDKWGSTQVSPESLPTVMRLNAVSREIASRPLQQHEAKWAERIHLTLSALDPVVAWFLVWSYALREVVQINLKQDKPVTFHLDQLVAHEPWNPRNRLSWNLWIRSPHGPSGDFHSALKYLAEQYVPPGVERELAQWATRQLIGPWDAGDEAEWDWHSLLERRYGQHSESQED
jgi:hypothetical protein